MRRLSSPLAHHPGRRRPVRGRARRSSPRSCSSRSRISLADAPSRTRSYSNNRVDRDRGDRRPALDTWIGRRSTAAQLQRHRARHAGSATSGIAADGRRSPASPARSSRDRTSTRHPDARSSNAARATITLVAQQSLAEVDDTVDSVTDVADRRLPLARPARRVWRRGTSPGARCDRSKRSGSEAASITGTTIHRRVPGARHRRRGRPARAHDERDARPARGRSAQRQRQFVSDASHELRSPLASIRTNLEVALRNPDRADWPAVAQRALAEDERMEDTVERAARARPARRGRGPQPLDLAARGRPRRARARRHRAAARASAIDTSRVSAGRVHGRREQLARVVRNLLDNAARHASSTVAVELVTTDDTGRAHRRRRRPGIAGRRPRARLRAVHPPRRRPRPRRRRPRARARDGEGHRRAATAARSSIDDAPIGGARFASAASRPPDRRYRAHAACPSSTTRLSFNCARRPAGPAQRRVRALRPRRGPARLRRRRDRGAGVVDARRRHAGGRRVRRSSSAPSSSSSGSAGPRSNPGRTSARRRRRGHGRARDPQPRPGRRSRGRALGRTVSGDPTPERGGAARGARRRRHRRRPRRRPPHVAAPLRPADRSCAACCRSCPPTAGPRSSPATATSGARACHVPARAGTRAVRGRTWPASRPHSQIDHILVRRDAGVVVLDSAVLPAVGFGSPAGAGNLRLP